MIHTDAAQTLKDFAPKHVFFVGIDSDGCVLNSMAPKQLECFLPSIVECWQLEAIAEYVRDAVDFVGLNSVYRGANRFCELVHIIDLLAQRKEVQKSGCALPDLSSLKQWTQAESKLSDMTLEQAISESNDPVLKKALHWSQTATRMISQKQDAIVPFEGVEDTLAAIAERADIAVVSGTQVKALTSEWKAHGIEKYALLIAGPEMGTKKQHLQYLTKGKYESHRAIMLGDSPGDIKAARANDVFFFPILPNREVESWQRFREEAFDKFLNGEYSKEYETERIVEFEACLPEQPDWI